MTTPVDDGPLLQQAADEQRRYDARASFWQRLQFRLRLAVLVLGIFTALFGVLSRGHIATEAFGSWMPFLLFGLPGLAVLLMLLIYAINPGQRWVAYRAGSESLKTETFLFATGAEKYAGVSAEQRVDRFGQRLESIGQLVADLQPHGLFVRLAAGWRNLWSRPTASPYADAPYTPATALDPTAYLHQRLLPQRDWYDSRGQGHRSTQGWLSAGVVAFNLVAGLLALVEQVLWIPVATTVVGALATYSALSNSEFLANSYRQTVLQLNQLLDAWERGEYATTPNGFQQFVLHVEQVIAREYTGWVQLEPGEAAK